MHIQTMCLKNKDIFNYSEEIEKAFCTDTRYLPAKVNFYIQKTAHNLKAAKEEIEETKNEILLHHGKYDDSTGYYEIYPEHIATVNKEINELFNLEQEISLYNLPLSWLDNVDFTLQQMNALMCMITDDCEEECFEEECYE